MKDSVQNELPSDKSIAVKSPIHELLKKRWSPLAFSDQPVEAEKLCSVLEAARLTASSYNEQPWSFIIATQDNLDDFNRLLSCLAAGNQEWAKHVPVLMLSVTRLHFEKNGAENRHAFHDVRAAATSLAIHAIALGLFVHQMAGFDVSKACVIYHIAEGFEPVAAIAPGYRGDSHSLSKELQQREASPCSCKPLDSFVFSGSWNQPFPWMTG
ncbi:MAG TPA: nitroreductase family protein [Coleofasciculaceae cyanobacterium]